MERLIELPTIIQTAVKALRAAIYVSMPAAVVEYDPDTQTASVQPMIADPRTDLTTGDVFFEDWGVIQNVPVAWPRMGGFVIAGFLKPKDQVVLEAFDLDPAAWKAQGRSLNPVNPGDLRKLGGQHWRVNPTDLTDAYIKSAPTSPGLNIGLDGGTPLIKITGNVIQLGASGGDFVALASKVLAEFVKIQATLASLSGATFGTPYHAPASVGSTLVGAQ